MPPFAGERKFAVLLVLSHLASYSVGTKGPAPYAGAVKDICKNRMEEITACGRGGIWRGVPCATIAWCSMRRGGRVSMRPPWWVPTSSLFRAAHASIPVQAELATVEAAMRKSGSYEQLAALSGGSAQRMRQDADNVLGKHKDFVAHADKWKASPGMMYGCGYYKVCGARFLVLMRMCATLSLSSTQHQNV